MRFSASVTFAAASLLARGAFASPIGSRALITNTIVVVEEIVVEAHPDGSHQTLDPKPVKTTTIEGFVVVTTVRPVSTVEDVTSTTPVPAPASASIIPAQDAAAVFKEKPQSTTTTAEPAAVTPIKAAEVVKEVSSSPPVETTQAPAPVPTTTTVKTSAAPSVAPVESTQSTSGKRGIAFNDVSVCNAFKGQSKVGWSYSWGGSVTPLPSGIEFIPTLWGLNGHEENWEKWAEEGIAAGSKHLFSFNEPDHPEQANLAVDVAVTGYLKYMQPYAGKARLGSPSVTNGGGNMGLTWLGSFLEACSSCTIDFVNIHWYNGGDVAAFKAHIEKTRVLAAGRKIWLTEFEAPGSPAEKLTWLDEVLPWLDAQDDIEGYSYFMARDGILVDGSGLTELGRKYVS